MKALSRDRLLKNAQSAFDEGRLIAQRDDLTPEFRLIHSADPAVCCAIGASIPKDDRVHAHRTGATALRQMDVEVRPDAYATVRELTRLHDGWLQGDDDAKASFLALIERTDHEKPDEGAE